MRLASFFFKHGTHCADVNDCKLNLHYTTVLYPLLATGGQFFLITTLAL